MRKYFLHRSVKVSSVNETGYDNFKCSLKKSVTYMSPVVSHHIVTLLLSVCGYTPPGEFVSKIRGRCGLYFLKLQERWSVIARVFQHFHSFPDSFLF